MERTADKNLSRLVIPAGALAIIVGCFAAYMPAIKGDFLWDDDYYVTENLLIDEPGGLYKIWFSTEARSQYFPLTYTTYWVEYRLWGFNPMGYHIVNVAIHIANALLLWLVLRRLSIPGAWLASVLFALHPVQVESVAWITERKNVLMLFFSLLSVLCWTEFVFKSNSYRKAILFYAGSLIFYALALLSKATACMLPTALVLILWFKRSPLTLRRWLQIAPFIIMGIGMGLLIMWWENHHLGTIGVKLGFGPTGKLIIAGRALWFYLWKLIWPANLAFSYARWNIDPTMIWQYVWPASAVLAILCLWLLRNRLGWGPVTALLFFAAVLFPMLGFFNLYTFLYTYVADHYQYAASIGPIALVAALGAIAFGRSDKNTKLNLILLAGIIIATLGTLTWRQSWIYLNSNALWQDTLKKNPDSWLAHLQISNLLLRQEKYDETLYHLDRAIELGSYAQKVDPRAFVLVFSNKGIIYEVRGQLEQAAEQYHRSLDLKEDVTMVHLHLADVLVRQKKIDDALLHYRRAIEIAESKNAQYWAWLAHLHISNLLFKQEKYDETLEHLDRVIELASYVKKVDPRAYSQAFYNKGLIFAARGQLENAAEQYEKAIEIQDDTAMVHFQLADILVELGKTDEAILHYRRALEIAASKEAEYLAEDIRQHLEFVEKQAVSPEPNQ